jgi:hypothetical protein
MQLVNNYVRHVIESKAIFGLASARFDSRYRCTIHTLWPIILDLLPIEWVIFRNFAAMCVPMGAVRGGLQ